MLAFSDVLKHSRFVDIMTYLICETEGKEKAMADYENKIQQSYEIFFTDIERLYSEANRKDDRLLDTVTEFIGIHDDIFFEAGMLVGFQLYKELDDSYIKHAKSDLPALLEQLTRRKENHQNSESTNSLLQIFSNYRICAVSEEIMNKNTEYHSVNEKAMQKIRQLEKIGLNQKQWQIADSVLSACNDRSTDYDKLTYMFGFKDAVKLIMEALEQ